MKILTYPFGNRLVRGKSVLTNDRSCRLDFSDDGDISVGVIYEEIQKIKEKNKNVESILINLKQHRELFVSFFTSFPPQMKNWVLFQIPLVISYIPECPVCSKVVIQEEDFVYACENHYKLVQIVNKMQDE